jgi:hypothetical protein
MVGQQFDVAINVVAGAQEVDTAQAYLDFDQTVVSVVSIGAGGTLPVALQSTFNNSNGTLGYAAFTFSAFPTGTFTLCTVRFAAIATSPSSPLTFHGANPRKTDAFRGVSVLNVATDGSVVVTAATATPTRTATATPAVIIDLSPSTSNVAPGDQFNVVVRVVAGAQEVDAAQAYLDFDPAVLQVVSITAGTSLPIPLQSTYNNSAGTLGYAAFTLSSFPTSTFTLCTVRFSASAPSPSSALTFHGINPRLTGAARAGVSILDTATGGSVVVTSATATATLAGTSGPTPTPTAPAATTPTLTAMATATSNSTSTPTQTATPSTSPAAPPTGTVSPA